MARLSDFDDPLSDMDLDPIMAGAYSEQDVPRRGSRNRNNDRDEMGYDNYDKPSRGNYGASTVSDVQFPTLSDDDTPGRRVDADVFSSIPVSVSVELGRSRISLKEVFELSEGSIIELERMVGEPLDLVVNGQVVAQGEVVAIDNNYGLRVTHIVSNNKK